MTASEPHRCWKHLASIFVALWVTGCGTTALPHVQISKDDHTTQWWGDRTDYGPKQHFVHAVRDGEGRLIDVYRYYLDSNGKRILDGPRDIYRWDRDPHDPGRRQLYRDGKLIGDGRLDFEG